MRKVSALLTVAAMAGVVAVGVSGAPAAPPATLYGLTATQWSQVYDHAGQDHDQALGYAVAIVQRSMEVGQACVASAHTGASWAGMIRDAVETNPFKQRTDQPAWKFIEEYIPLAYPCGVIGENKDAPPQLLGDYRYPK